MSHWKLGTSSACLEPAVGIHSGWGRALKSSSPMFPQHCQGTTDPCPQCQGWVPLFQGNAAFRDGHPAPVPRFWSRDSPSAADQTRWICRVPESILKPKMTLGTSRKSSGAAGGAGEWTVDGAGWRHKLRTWLTWWWFGIPLPLPRERVWRNEERCKMDWKVVLSRQDTGKRFQQRCSLPGSAHLHS